MIGSEGSPWLVCQCGEAEVAQDVAAGHGRGRALLYDLLSSNNRTETRTCECECGIIETISIDRLRECHYNRRAQYNVSCIWGRRYIHNRRISHSIPRALIL